MKIVAMVGGLGAQIMQYMFVLDIKSQLEDEEIFIDTSCFDYLDIWNGYELERIFGINHVDIWQDIKNSSITIAGSYRDAVLHYCYRNIDRRVCFYFKGEKHSWTGIKDILYAPDGFRQEVIQFANKIGWYFRHMGPGSNKKVDKYPADYLKQYGITYYDDFSHISDEYLFKNKETLRNVFRFPKLDVRNKEIADKMCTDDSVALHVRRSDHMYDNKNLFSRGYFKKAVQYMKSNLGHPAFYIFSEDMEWCRNNLDELGIDKTDDYVMIDWNTGEDSYRDMQLMTYCKNNILVMSSFSWCGYYLSIHRNKTVIAPEGWWLEVPIHM